MNTTKPALVKNLVKIATVVASAALMLSACGTNSNNQTTDVTTPKGDFAPVTIKHAFGETTIEKQPQRVATVAWANQEIPLALGVVPVGMPKITWGDDDTDGLHPWTLEKLTELGKTPADVVLFDETDGIDFEAISETQPDVIFATYSGITKEEYEKLSKIAPTVAYPEKPWNTSLEENIKLVSKGLGLEAEGNKLLADINQKVSDTFAKYPKLKERTILFTAFGKQGDRSKIGFYTNKDPRAGFLYATGLKEPKIVSEMSPTADSFWVEISAEKPELVGDVDLIVTYGSDDPAENEATVKELQADPLWSKIPAVKTGSIAFLGNKSLGSAAGPGALATPWAVDKYFELLNNAAK